MTDSTEPQLRQQLLGILDQIEPLDELEAQHLAEALAWATSGASLYRTEGGDPDPHLVSYFVPVVTGQDRGPRLLLGQHRKARLLLPPGGHVEHETPWAAVEREAMEELRLAAVAHPAVGRRPLFVTLTQVTAPPYHRDLSLWHVLDAQPGQDMWFDPREYHGVDLLTLPQVLDLPLDGLDPHMHRFARKLQQILESDLAGSSRGR
ncbi:NUDIX domain-containing protein [Streptacidiphilus sp. MAP5-52]|uniref:NUDIX domain-containing protein n=1 Tax=Streptacidiphilus sp. MAP5-52 TaxID=3156267 RepID=UPI00351168E2